MSGYYPDGVRQADVDAALGDDDGICPACGLAVGPVERKLEAADEALALLQRAKDELAEVLRMLE